MEHVAKELGIQPSMLRNWRRRVDFRVSTTDSDHALPIAPNLLDRNTPIAAANTPRPTIAKR